MGHRHFRELLSDIWLCFKMRLRLIASNKASCLLLLALTLSFSIIIGGLSMTSSQYSAIPVGIADEDGSPVSAALISRLRETEIINVHEGSRAMLLRKLGDNVISGLFVIEKGYGGRVLDGETRGLVTVIGAEDDRVSVLLSDIFAGAMLYDICASRGIEHYREVSSYDAGEAGRVYLERLEELDAGGALDYRFDISFTETSGRGNMSNDMIYRQMVFGMAAMLLSFISYFLCIGISGERESGVRGRRRLTPIRGAGMCAGDFAAVTAVMLAACTAVAAALASAAGYDGGDKFHIFAKLLLTALAYSFIMNLIFSAAASSVKGVTAYTVIGSAVVVVFGVCGFLHVFEGLSGINIPGMDLIPNCIYIDKLVQIF